MNWLNKAKSLVCILFGIGIFTSCSSDTEELLTENGTGFVSLSIQADAGFQTTRAASEDAYEDVKNYTVQILQGDKVVGDTCKWEYSKMPKEIELPNGDYTLKAFYGEDKAVGDEPYVEGTEDFTVKANVQKITVTCEPTSAKVAVTFDEKMEKFFSNYSVSITTKALTEGQTWEKADSEDIYYLKVEEKEQISMEISLANEETKQEFTSKKTYELSPGDYKNYKIAPKVNESGDGSLSITITFNEETTDHEIDITIPADWK